MKRQPVAAVTVLILLAGMTLPALLAAEEAAGTIKGTVRFTGEVPKPTEITTTDGLTIKHYDLLVEPKTKGLRYVFATLEDAPAQEKLKKAEPLVVDQKDLLFSPRVVAVQHGRAVRFDNSDRFNHNVMTTSTVEANQINRTAPPGEAVEHVFEPQKAPVMVGCSVHPWMKAWVYVVKHPWCAVSDEKGAFRIDKVPPGKYTLWLRHADTGLQERVKVAVEAGKTAEVAVEWKKVEKE